jgi:hypothetical protein
MSTTRTVISPTQTESAGIAELRRQYGCGPIEFSGSDNAMYERHLLP